MAYHYRNNETDFYTWCRHYVRQALITVETYVGNPLAEDKYREALKIKKQYELLMYSLKPVQREYFDRYLLGREPAPYNPQSWIIKDRIFENWRKICFPKGKSDKEKVVDPVDLGEELRHQRLKCGLSVAKAASIIGISNRTLFAYEKGTRMISLVPFYNLCELYKISMKEVIDRVAE